ncbi:MAG: FIG00996530: hypothetical protein [uncultured Nocardioidaceae bacterium]|uniref:Nudix hydrolase domain-containing protein n=1 Tax=uncultured Nocardioidaceae bacterium TaxID=253824 RepID=A0A6J4MCN2_9ACTN|nr:MAG: FIG00996530: hypothetical protein [uncultured Nocardioidaceae bacterium]
MHAARRLPEHLAAHAQDFAEGGRTPAEPRDASTVVLLRGGASSGPGSLEVYLQRRHLDMAFAAGMFVFPGGGVDRRDFDPDIDWVGPPPARWASVMGTDEALARALVCAAVRETFEESGVLLAGEEADRVVADTTGPEWEEDRRRLETGELSFVDFLRRRGLKLRTDLLRVWGSWLTPAFEPRRYRAWFFVAEVPAGQRTREASTESQGGTWLSVHDALVAVDDGEISMLPPTYCTCMELYDCGVPLDAFATAEERDMVPVEPGVDYDAEGAFLTIPDRLAALAESIGRRTHR